MFARLMIWFLAVMFAMPVFAQPVTLELKMPADLFGPGSTFSLDLKADNTGITMPDAQLFVALTVGTGDFWFYPGWKHFPPEIDWADVALPADSELAWAIIPAFDWPSNAGAFDGAMFIAAVIHNGDLVSNIADTGFGWSEEPVPTPTPERAAFVYIPPGTFNRGSPEDQPCRVSDESLHEVILSLGFYMMETEVTRRMWNDLQNDFPELPDDPSQRTWSPTLFHPLQSTTWYDALLFANLKSLRDVYTPCYYADPAFTQPLTADNYDTGNVYCNFNADGYRLPTEAEWEYAARAGTTGPFPFTEPAYDDSTCYGCESGILTVLEQHAVYCANSNWLAAEVAGKLPNPWGLYDILGNAGEWCWDWYDDYPSETVTNPTGPDTGTARVIRGSSWLGDAAHSRSARRFSGEPEYTQPNTIGFRLVRNAD